MGALLPLPLLNLNVHRDGLPTSPQLIFNIELPTFDTLCSTEREPMMADNAGPSSSWEGTGSKGRERETKEIGNATETQILLQTVLDVDTLQTIFSSDILSPRDRVNISCVSKAFKELAMKPLLSEVIWTKSQSMTKTAEAFESVYSGHASLVRKLTVNMTGIAYERRPSTFDKFLTELTQLKSLDVVSGFTFIWWDFLAAFLKISSLKSFKLTISDKCVVDSTDEIYDQLRSETFTSWNQLERLKIVFDTYSAHATVPPGLDNINWVRSFIKIPTVRHLDLELLWNNVTFVRYDLRLPSFRHLDTLRITTMCGEKDDNIDRLLRVVSTLRSHARVYLHLSSGKGREPDRMLPIKKTCPHGAPEPCSLEIDGPVGIVLYYLKRWKPSENYYPCGLQLYQSGAGANIDLSLTYLSGCEELQLIDDISLRAYADIETLCITSCSLDLDFIFGISQVCPNIVSLEIQNVKNESELDDHLYTIFGTDVLPSLRKLRTLHIPLNLFLGREQYMKEYLSGWSRYCPSLRNVILVPGTKWVRESPQSTWETITDIPISVIEGLKWL